MGGLGERKENYMKEYEYVTKKEYTPVKRELEKIIRKVKKIMETEEDISFYYDLIGSGEKQLITRLKNGNTGFDFDYNLIIETPKDYTWKAKEVKLGFIRAFNKALRGTMYECAEDSTSAITIKVVDIQNSKIIHSCDFAIIYYISDDINDGYKYIRNNKNGKYTFELRRVSTNFEKKIVEIEVFDKNGWNEIRDEYIRVKNSNKDIDKHSFILFLEAVNNVYNHINQKKEKSICGICFY